MDTRQVTTYDYVVMGAAQASTFMGLIMFAVSFLAPSQAGHVVLLVFGVLHFLVGTFIWWRLHKEGVRL